MNTSSSDTALPSGQMGSLKHLGLDGAVFVRCSRQEIHATPCCSICGQRQLVLQAKNMTNSEHHESRHFKSYMLAWESEPLMWKIMGKKNAAAELRKSMSNSVANSMRACWQLTKQYRQNGLWRYSVTVKWGGGGYRTIEMLKRSLCQKP